MPALMPSTRPGAGGRSILLPALPGGTSCLKPIELIALCLVTVMEKDACPLCPALAAGAAGVAAGGGGGRSRRHGPIAKPTGGLPAVAAHVPVAATLAGPQHGSKGLKGSISQR
jgi:hypothetical protein